MSTFRPPSSSTEKPIRTSACTSGATRRTGPSRQGLKHSLNLSFDFAHPHQEIGGYRTLNLLNSNNDATFVRTVLYSEIARHYLPIALTNYMRVVINGESWGVYINTQQFNKDFLRDWFKESKGARWKVPGSPRGRGGLEYLGDDVAAYKAIYEIKTRRRSLSLGRRSSICARC